MKNAKGQMRRLVGLMVVLMIAPSWSAAQQSQGGDSAFSTDQIESLLAPIALYPDSLLTQVLIAATYPLEVVQAARWAKANPTLKGDQLDAALQRENWDPSIKSLVNFPQVLAMMSDQLDWTQQLGDAMLEQQDDLIYAVQRLRQKAQAAGNLASTDQQQVIIQGDTIVIESAEPEVIYVPTYDPVVVYGFWPYRAYPPWPVYYPGWHPGSAAFATGVALGFAWGYAWGHFDWRHRGIDIDINNNLKYNKNINANRADVRKANVTNGKWQHDPSQRKGVAYRGQKTAERFGQGQRSVADGRRDFRGFDRESQGRAGQMGARDRGIDRPSYGSVKSALSQQSKSKGGDQSGLGRPQDSSAFSEMNKASDARESSDRGLQSRSSAGSVAGGGGTHGGGGGFHGGGRR
jgi:hypothetical protein